MISLLAIPRAEGRARELLGEETPSCPAALGDRPGLVNAACP